MIVKDTHCALWYEDEKLMRVLEAGRYEIPQQLFFRRGPHTNVELMGVREQELTVKEAVDPDNVQGSDPIQHAGAAPHNGTDRSIAHSFKP